MWNILRVSANGFAISEEVIVKHKKIRDGELREEHHVCNHNNMGMSVYLFTSRMNHSCSPNCDVFHRGDRIFVFALRSIACGEEISISYEPNIRQMKFGRKELLFNEFGFECRCPKCEEDGYGDDDCIGGGSGNENNDCSGEGSRNHKEEEENMEEEDDKEEMSDEDEDQRTKTSSEESREGTKNNDQPLENLENDVAFALESAIEPLIEQMNIEEAAKVGMKMISEAEIKGQLKDEHLDAFTAVMALKGNKFVITS